MSKTTFGPTLIAMVVAVTFAVLVLWAYSDASGAPSLGAGRISSVRTGPKISARRA
jgi:hypothetical protein